MQTVKTKIIQQFILNFAGIMAFSVLLLSVHAKDVFLYRELLHASKSGYHDIGEKAASELHDHVDKQVLKTFTKTFSDNLTISRGREEDYAPSHEQDPGIIGRVQETFLLWRIFASLPFAI